VTARRVYHFTRTYTEVQTFAVPANSWSEAKAMLEDDYFAELSQQTNPKSAGYTSQFKRYFSEKIFHCKTCNMPIATVDYKIEADQPVILGITNGECWCCRMKSRRSE